MYLEHLAWLNRSLQKRAIPANSSSFCVGFTTFLMKCFISISSRRPNVASRERRNCSRETGIASRETRVTSRETWFTPRETRFPSREKRDATGNLHLSGTVRECGRVKAGPLPLIRTILRKYHTTTWTELQFLFFSRFKLRVWRDKTYQVLLGSFYVSRS